MKWLFAALCLCSVAFALPTGGSVKGGKAWISQSENSRSLTVKASGKAIVEWSDFNIAPNEMVTFNQLQKHQAVLNRVKGNATSQILGAMDANCPIYLINPHGVLIGNSAQIQTAGLIASTADISNDNFLNQNTQIFENLQEGKIVNLGTISSKEGDVIFIARSIHNHGTINARENSVIFTTSELVLRPHEKSCVFIRIGNEEGAIVNSGKISALNTMLETSSPYAQAINHTGHIQALETKEEQGRIFLVAEKGNCVVDSSLNAPGGKIQVTAKEILLTESASLDTSSNQWGGKVILSGESAHVQKGAQLLANGCQVGDGGEVSVWTKEETLFYGKAQVRGGAQKGNGGTIRISTAGESYHLENGVDIVDASAPMGKAGKAIFDPKFIVVSTSGTNPATGQTFSFNPTGTATISGATLQSAVNAANVVLQANTDITFADVVEVTTANRSLELQAGRSINFIGHLTLNNGAFMATINDEGAQAANRDGGTAFFNMSEFSFVRTQGGDITVDVGTFGGSQLGEIVLNHSEINAGGGNIFLTGLGDSNGEGIKLVSSAIQTVGTGAITLQGTGGAGSSGCIGINILPSGTFLQTENGTLTLLGQGGGDSAGSSNQGILIGGKVSSSGTGDIFITGTAGSGVDSNIGVQFLGAEGGFNVVNGNATVSGIGNGSGNLNYGIRFESGASCNSTGTGTLTLTGTSGDGLNNNHGIILSGGTLSSETAAIFLTGNGQGTGDSNHGIRIEGNSAIVLKNAAPVTVIGAALAGTNQNCGISVSAQYTPISVVDGLIDLTGTTIGLGDSNQGVRVEGGIIRSTGTAPITINGIGGAEINVTGCDGFIITGSSSEITSVDGSITINGTAPAGGVQNKPIVIYPSNLVNTTGSGTITLNP